MKSALQRHAGLKPLARDHGVGLVCVQSLQRAVRASRTERIKLAQELKSVCNHLILPYLVDEEEILPSVITDENLQQKFKEHHAQIRKLVGALDKCDPSVDPGLGLFARVGDAIDDYVRWEEHTLFPSIEQELSDRQLEVLERATRKIDDRRTRPTQFLHRSVAVERRA